MATKNALLDSSIYYSEKAIKNLIVANRTGVHTISGSMYYSIYKKYISMSRRLYEEYLSVSN